MGSNRTKQKLYLDSNIFLNVWFHETSRYGEPYTTSKKLLHAIIDCHYYLVISNLVITELAKKTEMSEEIIIDEYLKEFRITNKMTIVKISKKNVQAATYLYSTHGIHMTDAIHAIAALSNQCILVTRDKELTIAAKNTELYCCKPEALTRRFS